MFAVCGWLSRTALIGSKREGGGCVECVCALVLVIGETLSHASRVSSVWVALQNSTDLTVPLHKFDKSQVQSCYYTSLAVDPMVSHRPNGMPRLTRDGAMVWGEESGVLRRG